MKKSHLVLLGVNLAIVLGFGALFLSRANSEFIIYVVTIIVFLGLVGISIKKVDYTLGTLVGLTVWSAMHMAGGGITFGENRLYDMILVNLSSEYPILRYDQIVHIWGFGTATLVIFCLLSRQLQRPFRHPVALGIVLVMGGLGVGAFNEIFEFGIAISVPESQIGGYINTSLDLCADLIGTIFGLIYIRARYWQNDGDNKMQTAESGQEPVT